MFIWFPDVSPRMDVHEILVTIKPTKKEEQQLKRVVQEVLAKINIPNTKPMLGGSGAKQTWLKHTHDVDIYVKFNLPVYKEKSSVLADILEKGLKKKFSTIKRLHGSRDYFQIEYRGYMFEIVPILNIQRPEQAQNTTDFSHLHVQYVLKHVKKRKSLTDEIRLVKQFAKANHVYGAESYIRGFSGYVLELLTLHYGSCMRLLQAAATWKKETIIGSSAKAKKLNPSKLSPLIVMDPVQPDRNAAAALSEEKFYDFIMTARAFLKHKSLSFFKMKHINVHHLKKLGKLIHFEIKTSSGNKDIIGTRLLKVFTFIKEEIRRHDFTLIASAWAFEHEQKRAMFYYVVNPHLLPPTKTYVGPPLTKKQAVEGFKRAHADVHVKNGLICAREKRNYREIEFLIQFLIKSEFVTERVKKIEFLKN